MGHKRRPACCRPCRFGFRHHLLRLDSSLAALALVLSVTGLVLRVSPCLPNLQASSNLDLPPLGLFQFRQMHRQDSILEFSLHVFGIQAAR